MAMCRHIILTSGPELSCREWNVVCLSLCRSAQLTLYPLHQLMSPFHRGSDSFYGDIGDVKVAARRDSCKKETHRLMQLAQQVTRKETSYDETKTATCFSLARCSCWISKRLNCPPSRRIPTWRSDPSSSTCSRPPSEEEVLVRRS